MDAPEQTFSDILQDSLQKDDNALLFASDVACHSDETQHAVVADMLVDAVCGGGGHWKAALSYLQHALAVGLAPIKYTLAALLTRLPGLRDSKHHAHLACLLTVEEFLPMLCLETDAKGEGLEDGPSLAPGTLELLLSACTTLLAGVLQRANEDQRLLLPGQGEELEGVRIALRTVHKLLDGRKTGPLLRLGQKASHPSWSHLRAQMDELAGAPALPGDQQHLSEALLASWRRLQVTPPAGVRVVAAMQAGRDGWRPWAVGSAGAWLPLEVLLEDMVEGKKLPHLTAADALAGLLRVLRSIEDASWVDALLALWLAALRSVQRGHEEPFHTETRLSLLLAIVPMAIQAVLAPPPTPDPAAAFLVDDLIEVPPSSTLPSPPSSDAATPQDLSVCLDLLHQFPLLLPAPPAASAAASAAAARCVSPTLMAAPRHSHNALSSPLPIPSPAFFGGTPSAPTPIDPPPSSSSSDNQGDLRDLIVEACSTRALLLPSSPPPAMSPPAEPPPPAAGWGAAKNPWEQLMAGAALTASLRAAILATPASRREELERVYSIAVGGHDTDEQAAAASTLCGASLVRGWAIQEHAVRLSIQLLTPPRTDDPSIPHSGGPSASPFRYLVSFAPMLFAALAALAQADTLEIVRLHGQLPHLAAALLPIADVFGDMPANSASSAATADDHLVHSIFSQAFLLLSRILETFASPATASSPPGPLSLSCLLDLAAATPSPVLPSPTLAHFPRVAAWYRDHQGFSRPPHSDTWRPRVTEQLLRMLFPPDSKASGGSGQRKTPTEPVLASAWDVIAAAPELGNTLLTACASGRLAAKDLAQGLRTLLVYLPAVAVPLAHYFVAEVVRGAWRPAVLNGTEWPSPASCLPAMEADIAALLRQAEVVMGGSAEGAHATNGGGAAAAAAYGNTVPTVPLPLVAALSLVLAGTGDMSEAVASAVLLPLLRCSAAQPWPTLPIVAALLAPILRHSAKQLPPTAAALWCAASSDRTRKVVASCFHTALHPTLERPSGITSLLGESRLFGVRDPHPLPPGAMYIRAAPHCSGGAAIASDVAERVLAQASGKRGIAGPGSESRSAPEGPASAAKRLRCRQDSLREALPVVTQAAGLGACLLAMAGRDAVRALFVDVLPPLLTNTVTGGDGRGGDRKGGFRSYALARLVVLSGLLAWGQTPGSFAGQALEEHVEFLVGAGGVPPPWMGSSLGQAYLVALAALLAGHAPAWLAELGNETLIKLSRCVASVGARDLALRLLECGNSSNVAAYGELVVGLR